MNSSNHPPNNSHNYSNSSTNPRVIMIYGPTGAGKTSLAHALARPGQDIIINADSRQFYHGMDIGTAKPSPKEQKLYNYALLDFLEPGEEISAFDFLTRTLDIINTSYPTSSQRIYIVGGSMFYQDVLRSGLPESVTIPENIKTELSLLYQSKGLHELQVLLKKHDPEYFQEVDTHNHRRLLRALEVIFTTQKTFTAFRKARKSPPLNILPIAVTYPRRELYQIINERVKVMFQKGWVREVKNLLTKYSEESLIKTKTIGYEEIITLINQYQNSKDAETEQQKVISLIGQKTRNMAKNQLNWIKKHPPTFLVVPNLLKHGKTNTDNRKGCYEFSDLEDVWMNGFELYEGYGRYGAGLISQTNGENKGNPITPSPTCKLILYKEQDRSKMLTTLEHIIGGFYE